MNKIGWCDFTWNPVWGCQGGCRYCYSKKIAKRFAKQIAEKEIKRRYDGCLASEEFINALTEELADTLKKFQPTWLEYNFRRKFPKKPCRIFVDSMSDICWWDMQWMGRVLKKIAKYPQHTFQFLTRNPLIYDKYDFPQNCWLGWTVTKRSDFLKYCYQCGPLFMQGIQNDDNIFFASFEPLHGPLNENIVMSFDWIIIGAETGNRKHKKLPKLTWIDDIYQTCYKHKIPIYFKDSLAKEFPGLVLKKEFPQGEITNDK